MEDREIKRLRRVLLTGKLTDNIIKYNSDGFGTVYFIPQRIEGNEVYGHIVTPNSSKPTNKLSLGSLVSKDISISKFDKIKI